MTFDYPQARRDNCVFDDYHGSKVPDPYRWMEDPDAEETKQFVDAQNAVTMPFIEKCQIRQKLHDSIKEMWDYPKYSCPEKHGPRYFYYYNTGLQNQSVLYVQDSINAKAHIFLDPNKLSPDGTTSLRGTSYSEDGKYFAYGMSHAGSDWVTIKFRNVETEEDLPDTLERVKFSCMAWTHDNAGLFYNMYPEQEGKADGTETTANFHQKLYFHRLGSPQSDDVLCAEFPDYPKWSCGVEVSDCGRYLVASVREGCDPVNRLWYCDLNDLPDGIKGVLPFKKVVDNFDSEYEYLTNKGTVFTFKTNKDAPKYKVINIDFSKPEEEHWQTLVDEDTDDVLEWAACVNKTKLVLCYLHHVKNVMHLYDLFSGQREVTFPLDIGSVVGYSGKQKDTEIFYNFMSFVTPGIIYRCDLTEEKLEPVVFRETEVSNFALSDFVQSQVFYPSKDGTKIPMFIIHKKNLPLDGKRPVFLYGYGGFNVSITPYFSVSRTIFMKHFDGVYAVPNIRGGGEYGEKWHKGGCYGKKQNVFDDFHAAAQYLIDNNYSVSENIIINGGSNGGLLVAACANQKPDLYGCVVAQVGVMDMLRFHKFTIGHAWTTDYGSADNRDDFEWLIKYSPLHNITVPEGDVQYPTTLLLTGDHDDRVVPLHSLKFIAQLQNTVATQSKQNKPLMIRIDTKSGHGAGKPTSKVIEELTDVFSFIQLNLNLEWNDSKSKI